MPHGRSADSLTKQCTEPGCDRPLRARGWCNAHYKQWSRAEGRSAPTQWNDRRRSNYHARRARMNGVHNGDVVMTHDLITRDGTQCAGCDQPIDLDLTYPHPMSKSIDHINPISRGGMHTLNNTQLMHLRCNVSKGDSQPNKCSKVGSSR